MNNQIISVLLVTLMLFACDRDDKRTGCPTYDIVPQSTYTDPICHPSGKIVGFNHIPIKEIHYSNGFECPHQATYIYEEDSLGFWLIEHDGSNQRRVLPYTLTTPSWSSDGKWIAYSKNSQICIMPFDGSQFDTTSIIQLTNSGKNFHPSWSPDSNWIAYDSNTETESGTYFIWKMKTNGSEKSRIAYTPSQGSARMPFWGKDFSIMYQKFLSKGTPEIFVIDSTGNEFYQLTNNDFIEEYPQFSPNGVYFSYISNFELKLWIVNLATKTSFMVADRCTGYSWFPNGKIVFVNYDYTRIDEVKGTLWIMDSDGTNKKQLTKNFFKIIL